MKVISSCFNKKQLNSLKEIGIVIDPEKEYTEEEEFNIFDRINSHVMAITDIRSNRPEEVEDYWQNILDIYEKHNGN